MKKRRHRSLRKGDPLVVSQHGVTMNARATQFGHGEVYWREYFASIHTRRYLRSGQVYWRDLGETWIRGDASEEAVLAFRSRIALLR